MKSEISPRQWLTRRFLNPEYKYLHIMELFLILSAMTVAFVFSDAATIPVVSLMPCNFFALTGLECPSCGMTRACCAFAHGRFADAWHYHPAVFLLFPAGIWRVIQLFSGFATGYYPVIYRQLWIWLLLPAYIICIGLFRFIF